MLLRLDFDSTTLVCAVVLFLQSTAFHPALAATAGARILQLAWRVVQVAEANVHLARERHARRPAMSKREKWKQRVGIRNQIADN